MHKFGSAGRIITLFALMAGLSVSDIQAQDTKDVNARSPNPAAMSKLERKAQKKKLKQRDLLDKAIEKGRKRHEKIQSREVRKRMKKSKRTASMNRAHEKEFFLKRWFESKPKKKSR